MIAIIDYGVGNLFSLQSSFSVIGQDAIVTNDRKVISGSDGIVLPGVGAFCDAAEKLRNSGLDQVILSEVRSGKKLLGICLGMQLLFDRSYENGCYEGLGILRGSVIPIADSVSKDYKIPQIGWNSLRFKRPSPLFSKISDGDYVYFVHSYYASDCEDSVIAVTDYGTEITAAVSQGNVFGCQFHPEKSGQVGLNILKSFSEEIK